jgi:hypothetical protein
MNCVSSAKGNIPTIEIPDLTIVRQEWRLPYRHSFAALGREQRPRRNLQFVPIIRHPN